MKGKRLNKKELAFAKVMTELGHTPSAVAKVLGRSHHTIIVHLQQTCDDPEVSKMVELIKRSELQELQTIGWKSRTILNDYLDRIILGEKEANPISVTAILDRTFQQKRLLEGSATQRIDIHAVAESADDLSKRLAELQEERRVLSR